MQKLILFQGTPSALGVKFQAYARNNRLNLEIQMNNQTPTVFDNLPIPKYQQPKVLITNKFALPL